MKSVILCFLFAACSSAWAHEGDHCKDLLDDAFAVRYFAALAQPQPPDFFMDQSHVVQMAAEHFARAARDVHAVYEAYAKDGATLPVGATRAIYLRLTRQLQETYRQILGPVAEPLLDADSRLFRVFGWAFNRMKRSSADPDTQLEMLTRGMLSQTHLPYAMHTHLDVPLSSAALGFAPSELAFALAMSHDTFEEGSAIQDFAETPAGKKALTGEIKLERLAQMFEPKFGQQLARGIRLLTESEVPEFEPQVGMDAFGRFIQSAFPFIPKTPPGLQITPEWSAKYFFIDPLVFGGLALQLSKMRLLLPADDELIPALIETELADRLSDIGTMDRFLARGAAYARYRTLLYASRMFNMLEKLIPVAEQVPNETWRKTFHTASTRYLQWLWAKVEMLNMAFVEEGQPPISQTELIEFYVFRFREIQKHADTTMASFIEQKVRGL